MNSSFTPPCTLLSWVNKMTPNTSMELPWVSGRDFVIATDKVRNRLKQVVNSEEMDNRWLIWNNVPLAISDCDTIQSLRIMVSHDERPPFPTSIYGLRMLSHVSFPIEYIEIEHPQDWRDNLLSLDLNERENARASLAHGSRFTALRRLSCVTSVLGFNGSSFPMLEWLELNVSRQARIRKELSGERLRRAHFTGIRSLDEIPVADVRSISHLAISRSSLTDLVGIGRFAAVSSLRLKDFPKLESLSGIAELPHLTNLELLYCPRLHDEIPLTEHAMLQKLTVVSCKNLALREWNKRKTQEDAALKSRD